MAALQIQGEAHAQPPSVIGCSAKGHADQSVNSERSKNTNQKKQSFRLRFHAVSCAFSLQKTNGLTKSAGTPHCFEPEF